MFDFWLELPNPSQTQSSIWGAIATEFVMEVIIVVFGICMLQSHFVFSGRIVSHCNCPDYVEQPGRRWISFCGYEIIEKRASAKLSTRNCKPNFTYRCDHGPNQISVENECESNKKCIPGSSEYQTVKQLKNSTSTFYSNNLVRFCATFEGKTNTSLILAIKNYMFFATE